MRTVTRRVIDMTIDEAILLERETVRRNKMMLELNKLMQESHAVCFDKLKRETSIRIHEQLAEWFEELKAYREIGTVEECRNSVLDIPKAYNKAIDDCLKIVEWDGYTLDIKHRIEKLKEGVENE